MLLGEFRPSYITFCERGDVLVAAFALPQLTEEDNIEQLGRELFALCEQFGCRKVVLTLHNVTHMTSSVLGKLITLHRKLHRRQGILVICNLGADVAHVFHTSHLWDYFHIAKDLDAALQAVA